MKLGKLGSAPSTPTDHDDTRHSDGPNEKTGNKGAANGYAPLDAGGLILDSDIPAAIARDSELHDALTLAGAFDYITLAGQVLTRNAIDLAADVTGALPIGNGGSGQTTRQAAIDALTDVAAATAEHVLTKDTATGNAIFKAAAGGGGTPGGADTQVQFNDGGAFGGDAGLTYAKATDILTVVGGVSVPSIRDSAGTVQATIGASSPHFIVENDLRVDGRVGLAGTAPVASSVLKIQPSETIATFIGIEMAPGLTGTGNNSSHRGVSGQLTSNGPGGVSSGHTAAGLFFNAAANVSGGKTTTFADVSGLDVQGQIAVTGATSTGIVTALHAGKFQILAREVLNGVINSVVNAYGVRVLAPSYLGTPVIDEYAGVKIENEGGTATISYGLHIPAWSGNYAIFVDGGLCRFDGNGTRVFELPADAIDPTGGGGAATGRIPVLIGGVTRYLAYY